MTDMEYVEMGIIARKVREASDFIQEVKPYQLQLLQTYITRQRGKIAEQVNNLLRLPENWHVTVANFPEWKELEALEQLVKIERDRRSGQVAPKKKRGKGLSYRAFAYFHFYSGKPSIKEQVKAAAAGYGLRSGGTLYNEFILIVKNEYDYRTSPAHITDLQEAIKLMEANEIDKRMIQAAESDLKKAEFRPPKK